MAFGFGSPSGLPGANYSYGYGAGFGDPSDLSDQMPEGFGSPQIGHTSEGIQYAPWLMFLPIQDFWVNNPQALDGRTGAEYSDKGGEVIHLYSPNQGWPITGPYTCRLLDVAGNYWPDDADGCYSCIADGGNACYTNGAREILRFALPRVPVGVYSVEVSWNNNTSRVTLDEVLSVVPHSDMIEPDILKSGFA